MRRFVRPTALAGAGLLFGAGEAWAHPGHHALAGAAQWVGHALASPYHMGIVVLAAVAVVWVVRARRVVREARDR